MPRVLPSAPFACVSWHEAQERVPSPDSCGSAKSLAPRAIICGSAEGGAGTGVMGSCPGMVVVPGTARSGACADDVYIRVSVRPSAATFMTRCGWLLRPNGCLILSRPEADVARDC